MASKWINRFVAVNCGEVLGEYCGKVVEIDSVNQTISLTDALRNGVAFSLPKVTLNSQDITAIHIIDKTEAKKIYSNTKESNVSTVAGLSGILKKSQPGKLDERKITNSDNRKKATTPKKVDQRRRFAERDDACFNEPVDDFIMENDFDFEKNLALFDKRAVFNELTAMSKPDVVRLPESYKRSQQLKYRCDENVLESEPAIYRQISVPCVVEKEFFTDSGLIVPSITRELRQSVLNNAERMGFTVERRLEMVGRSATEMILQLIGGSHRLNPQNTHQRPTVVVLCQPHIQGAQGVNCARQLSNHGVNVCLMTLSGNPAHPQYTKELNLYKYTGFKIATIIGDLPSSVDIIVGALDSVNEEQSIESFRQKSLLEWVKNCRAPVLCLDPPPGNMTLSCKWVLTPLLPFAFSETGVSVYLCDLGLSNHVFKNSGITYVSAFGSKFVIPLYDRNMR